MTEAETRWALFVTKHNLAFFTSDHATKLLNQIFKESETARKFSCARTKCTAIIKEALALYFTSKLVKNLVSILIDESNDKNDISCIVLVRVFDPEIGEVRTQFLDMPEVMLVLLPIYLVPWSLHCSSLVLIFQTLFPSCQIMPVS